MFPYLRDIWPAANTKAGGSATILYAGPEPDSSHEVHKTVDSSVGNKQQWTS